MDSRHKRSWTLIFQAACKLRDHGFNIGGANIDKFTIAQERVLQTVAQHSPQGVMLKDIAREVALTPGAVSQIIEFLVKEGLVDRISDANDRRAVNIHVTRKFEEIRSLVVEQFDREMESVLARTSVKDREAFVTVLERLIDKVSVTRDSVRRYSGDTLLAMEDIQ